MQQQKYDFKFKLLNYAVANHSDEYIYTLVPATHAQITCTIAKRTRIVWIYTRTIYNRATLVFLESHTLYTHTHANYLYTNYLYTIAQIKLL